MLLHSRAAAWAAIVLGGIGLLALLVFLGIVVWKVIAFIRWRPRG